MRNYFLLFVFLFCVYTAEAQEQQPGIVKTIGRRGQAGEPLGEVMIRAQGTSNATLSDNAGNFNLVLANHDIGQAYSLSRVFKMGYKLVDEGIIGRQYPYSNQIPLEIAMVSNATSTVVARVVQDSQASQMGLSGAYHVVSYEEWDIARNDANFFVYNRSLASRQKRTYVLYRDDEFFVIPFEGVLGIKISPEWISQEDKLDLIRKYKKWARKNK